MVCATAAFKDVAVVPIGSNVINVAGTAVFTVRSAPAPFVLRSTQVYVNEDDAWKIVSHHASRIEAH
jgi:hypothetical protein